MFSTNNIVNMTRRIAIRQRLGSARNSRAADEARRERRRRRAVAAAVWLYRLAVAAVVGSPAFVWEIRLPLFVVALLMWAFANPVDAALLTGVYAADRGLRVAWHYVDDLGIQIAFDAVLALREVSVDDEELFVNDLPVASRGELYLPAPPAPPAPAPAPEEAPEPAPGPRGCPICFDEQVDTRRYCLVCPHAWCAACHENQQRHGHVLCPFCRSPVVGYVAQVVSRAVLETALSGVQLARNGFVAVRGWFVQTDTVGDVRLAVDSAGLWVAEVGVAMGGQAGGALTRSIEVLRDGWVRVRPARRSTGHVLEPPAGEEYVPAQQWGSFEAPMGTPANRGGATAEEAEANRTARPVRERRQVQKPSSTAAWNQGRRR